MATMKKRIKTTIYPRPHNFGHSWSAWIDSADQSYLYPLISYDEGQGAHSAYEANPVHASFVPKAGSKCFPDSKIDKIFSQLTLSLAYGSINTDKLSGLKIGVMPIAMAFKDDYTAIDELSSTEVQDVLEMQTEATHKQGYPVWSGTDTVEKYTDSDLLDTDEYGLTTNTNNEKIVFDPELYYDANQYMIIDKKLRNCNGGLKWYTLTQKNPIKQIRFSLPSKVKYMNPYTFYGILITVPQSGTKYQIPTAAETSAITHLHIGFETRYYEWHEGFNMDKM